MKKILAVVPILLLAAACAAPPTNKQAESVANTNSAVETAPPAVTEADAIAKEKAAWDAIKNKDYDAFAQGLASDWMEVLPEGVLDKTTSVEGVKQFEPSEITFSDWKFLSINKNSFVISYTVATKGKFQGKELPPASTRASSAWIYRDKKWVTIYHQECPVRLARPGSAIPKPAPSPVEQPPIASPGPDAIANETAVWESFKNKNYAAFEAMLADDFLEVAPDGFYDKAASVKAVTMFDTSKSVLSDFKTAKLDDNATLVTYVVTDPRFAPKGERHSTIWATREGKWRGVFHQGGTVVGKPLPPPPTPSATPTPRASPSPKASPA